MSLTPEERRHLEQYVQEDLENTRVVSATVSVDEDGRVTVEELVVRTILQNGVLGTAYSTGMRPEDPERGVVLDRYVGPGSWSTRAPQQWQEVTAADYQEELADALRPPWRPGDDADRPEDRT